MPDLNMQAFVPKHRKPKFDLHLKIYDVNNLPYISGHSYVKWHLAHPAAAEHGRGSTDRCHIKEHKVTWNYETHVPLKLVIDKNSMLQESHITFEIRHEINGLSKLDTVNLGTLKLNLAEFVEASEHEGEDGVTKRYLLQESKINCTIKVCMFLKQVDGDRNYIAPPMKTAQVFTGISGILLEEAQDGDAKHVPVLSRKMRDGNEDYRDLYRRTVAANWTCMAGEPPADRVIEDIFNGGDGWCNNEFEHTGDTNNVFSRRHGRHESTDISDSAATLKAARQRNRSGLFSRWSDRDRKKASHESIDKDDEFAPGGDMRGRESFESNRSASSWQPGQREREEATKRNYVSESTLKSNLRDWNLRSYAYVSGRDTRDEKMENPSRS